MATPASDELAEALTRLHSEREGLLADVADLEKRLGERHEALIELNEKIEAMEKTLAMLRTDLAEELQLPPADQPRGEALPRASFNRAPASRNEAMHGDMEELTASEAIGELPRQLAVLGLLASAERPPHYQELADITGAPESEVSPILSHLEYRGLVETTAWPGRYQIAGSLPMDSDYEVNTAVRRLTAAIVDERLWDICDEILSMDQRLPFVGFEHFRRNRLPRVANTPWGNERFTHAVMKELLAREFIEVYRTENPRNPDFPTAAIRLTPEGLEELDD